MSRTLPFMTYAEIEQARDAVFRPPAELREINKYLAQRQAKAEKWKQGRLKQANESYRAGLADVANVKRLAEAGVARAGTVTEAKNRLARLRRALAAGQDAVTLASTEAAEVGAVDPVQLWERERQRFPALNTRVGDDTLPACLSQ